MAYATQMMLCWRIGQRLSKEHLQGGRGAYGKQILVTVSRELPRLALDRPHLLRTETLTTLLDDPFLSVPQ